MTVFTEQRKLEIIAENLRSFATQFNEQLNEARKNGMTIEYYRSNMHNMDKLVVGKITKKVSYEHSF